MGGGSFSGGTPLKGGGGFYGGGQQPDLSQAYNQMFSGGTPLLGANTGSNRDYEKLIQFGYPEEKARWMAGNGINPTWGRVWPAPHWQIGQGHKML
jgi:hypothetical protein